MILDIKSYIKLNEELNNNKVITDIVEIESCFKNAASNECVSLGIDRNDMVEKTEPNMKQYANVLLQCEIPTGLNNNILVCIDNIFLKYVEDYFESYAIDQMTSYLDRYDDYVDFKYNIYDDYYQSIVEAFFQDVSLYTHNVSICAMNDADLYIYCDISFNETYPYDQDWDDNKCEIIYKNALKKTYDKLEEIFETVANDEFSEEDWISETERVFGGESGYWKYKGF